LVYFENHFPVRSGTGMKKADLPADHYNAILTPGALQ
jgi:hypothetical protein